MDSVSPSGDTDLAAITTADGHITEARLTTRDTLGTAPIHHALTDTSAIPVCLTMTTIVHNSSLTGTIWTTSQDIGIFITEDTSTISAPVKADVHKTGVNSMTLVALLL